MAPDLKLPNVEERAFSLPHSSIEKILWVIDAPWLKDLSAQVRQQITKIRIDHFKAATNLQIESLKNDLVTMEKIEKVILAKR